MQRQTWPTAAGSVGLLIGVALMTAGAGGGDVAALAGGYGALLALSAAWLLGGLALRSHLARRPSSYRTQARLTR